jgi:cytoskeletal protein RodZ
MYIEQEDRHKDNVSRKNKSSEESNSSSEKQEPKKKTPWRLIIIGLVILAAALIIWRFVGKGYLPADQNTDPRDINDVEKEGKWISNEGLKPLSDGTVIAGTSTYDASNHLILTEALTSKHGELMDQMAKSLSANGNAKPMAAGLGWMLGNSNMNITEKQLELWLQTLKQWTDGFSDLNSSVGSSYAKILREAGIAIDAASDCHTYEYVRITTESMNMNSNEVTNTTVKNNGGGILFGLLGNWKNSDKTIEHSFFQDKTETRKVDYMPVCLGTTIDPSKLDAVLAAQRTVMLPLMMAVADYWNTFPDVKSFFGNPADASN